MTLKQTEYSQLRKNLSRNWLLESGLKPRKPRRKQYNRGGRGLSSGISSRTGEGSEEWCLGPDKKQDASIMVWRDQGQVDGDLETVY